MVFLPVAGFSPPCGVRGLVLPPDVFGGGFVVLPPEFSLVSSALMGTKTDVGLVLIPSSSVPTFFWPL